MITRRTFIKQWHGGWLVYDRHINEEQISRQYASNSKREARTLDYNPPTGRSESMNCPDCHKLYSNLLKANYPSVHAIK